ncbi:MAG: putative diacylglycerol O-acyltransferase [Pseudomonadales bacterium]|nr:putative diacylglycerol O-acyltransferase [Pseudomonadales bacterium]
MRQLGVIDAAFINLENPTVPQQIGGLGIYDPSTAPGKFVRFKDVLANFEQRLAKLPIFRTRLVEVPLGLDRPYWVLDPHFDVEFHIRHIALPKPGDWRQLCIQVARLHSRPLDMSRPLWEAYIIEGLDNIPNLPPGCFAVYTKIHHSLVDGAGGQSFMAAIHDLEPVPSHSGESHEPPARFADVQPSDVRLLGQTLMKAGPRLWSYTKGMAKIVGGMGSMAKRMLKEELPPLQMTAPKSRFDQPVGHNRVFEAREFLLSEFKELKNAAGMTINDVAVAVVAGAMRKYLMAHNELPAESLCASMPVNMRSRVGETGDNNQVGAMSAMLHTDIEDPVERLQAIKKSLDDAKAYIDTPLTNIVSLPGAIPPAIAKPLARMYVRNKLTRHMPMGQATVITNVPGPPFDLYCAGARMVSYYPLGLINPGLGLFHAVFSCGGKIAISVLGDRDQMPDPEFYRACLDAAYEELRAALLGRSAQTVGTRRKQRVTTAVKTRAAAARTKAVAARGKAKSATTGARAKAVTARTKAKAGAAAKVAAKAAVAASTGRRRARAAIAAAATEPVSAS